MDTIIDKDTVTMQCITAIDGKTNIAPHLEPREHIEKLYMLPDGSMCSDVSGVFNYDWK